ncbi:HAD-IA family hydrolase [Rhodococcus sp. GXMU-t2271]|uniref:HAD-IA family hydrolase n=1 Tax=Rhodococcus TaxID=1827 RepID=UPI00352B7071
MRGLVLDFGGVLAGPGTDAAALGGILAEVRRRGVRTAILSNDPGGAAAAPLRDLGRGRLVDEVVLSADVGTAKPDPRSYLAVARRLGLEPSVCVFVDDLRVNVDGAVAAGMVGVHHADAAEVVAELTVLFGLDVPSQAGAARRDEDERDAGR